MNKLIKLITIFVLAYSSLFSHPGHGVHMSHIHFFDNIKPFMVFGIIGVSILAVSLRLGRK